MRPAFRGRSPIHIAAVSALCLSAALAVLPAPPARAEFIACSDGQDIAVPVLTLNPSDADLNELSAAPCTDSTPDTTTEIAAADRDPGYPELGWARTVNGNALFVRPDFVAGQMRFDVHVVSHFNQVGTPVADEVDVTLTFTALAPSDLGIEGFAHSGSTVPGEASTYSFEVVNGGPLDPRDHTYGLQVLDPKARIEAAPAGCEPPVGPTVSCHAAGLAAGATRPVSFTVRNGESTGDAKASVFGTWVEEPEEEDELHSNEALLRQPLGPAPPAGGAPPPAASTTPPAAPPGKLSMILPKHRSAFALKQGWGVKVKASKPGVLKLTLEVGAETIARGAARAHPGKTVTVRLEATRAAAKHIGRFAGKRARLTVVQGQTKATQSLTLR